MAQMPEPERATAYRGYSITPSRHGYHVSQDGHHIYTGRTLAEAKAGVDAILGPKRNPARRRVRAVARRSSITARRVRAPRRNPREWESYLGALKTKRQADEWRRRLQKLLAFRPDRDWARGALSLLDGERWRGLAARPEQANELLADIERTERADRETVARRARGNPRRRVRANARTGRAKRATRRVRAHAARRVARKRVRRNPGAGAPHSERDAWRKVKGVAIDLDAHTGRKGPKWLRAAGDRLFDIADAMLAQLGAGVHANPRRNPTLAVIGNPPMGRVVEIRYRRDRGSHPGYYKHTFKRGHEPTLHALSDGSLKIG